MLISHARFFSLFFANCQGKLREALQLVVDTSVALDTLRGKVEVKSAALNNHFGTRTGNAQRR